MMIRLLLANIAASSLPPADAFLSFSSPSPFFFSFAQSSRLECAKLDRLPYLLWLVSLDSFREHATYFLSCLLLGICSSLVILYHQNYVNSGCFSKCCSSERKSLIS